MMSLMYWILCLFAGVSAGVWMIDRLKIEINSGAEKIVLAMALGHGLLAYSIFIFGSLGLLKRPIMVTFIVVVSLIFNRSLILFFRNWMGDAIKDVSALGLFQKILISIAVIVALFSLAGALAPAVGQDELCYHLMQPKNYVRAGAIYEVPFSLNSLWPYLMEMLFTLGVLLRGAELAKLFHFSITLTAVLAVYSFTKRFFDIKKAVYAALIFWLTPAVYIQASFAYIDNALAAFIFLAIYAWLVYRENKQFGWAVLAGTFAGLAISTKLTGLIILPVLLVIAFWDTAKSQAKIVLIKGMVVAALATFVAGSIWYFRAWYLRGNPVFPFFPQFFAGHGWQDSTYVNAHGRSADLGGFLLFPWDLAMHPEWFGGEHIGVIYLMLVPLLLMVKLKRPVSTLLFYVLAYSVLWYRLDPNVRFFFPGLLLLCPVLAHALVETQIFLTGSARLVYGGLIAAAFLIQAVFAPYHFWEEGKLLFHRNPAQYLKAHERSYFAATSINKILSKNDKILSANELRGYYFDSPFVLDGDFTRFTHYDEKFSDAGEVRDYLKSLGFTHILTTDLTEGKGEPLSPLRILSLTENKASVAGKEFFKEQLILRSGKTRYALYRIL